MLTHCFIYLLINSLFVCTIFATASLNKEDYDFSFWLIETEKNPNLSIIDRRTYDFKHFSAKLPLHNQTQLYEQLKVQLNHLLQHLKELCNDPCMQQACKAGTDTETFVKDWSIFKNTKWSEMPYVPKKETIYNVKNQIEWIQDSLQALSYAFCPMTTNY